MSVTHRITESISSDASSAVSGSSSEVGASETNPNALYPAATTNLLITMSFTIANLQSILLVSDKGLTLKTNGTAIADVQTITITGTPAGGSFPLGFGGQVTLVPYNASASDVQVALRALSTIGGTNVTCTGGPLPGTPVVCTFSGTMVTGYRDLITTSSVALTGGSSPTVTITHTTPGKPSNTLVLGPNIPYKWGRSRNYEACLFTLDVTSAYVSCTPAASLKGKILTS